MKRSGPRGVRRTRMRASKRLLLSLPIAALIAFAVSYFSAAGYIVVLLIGLATVGITMEILRAWTTEEGF